MKRFLIIVVTFVLLMVVITGCNSKSTNATEPIVEPETTTVTGISNSGVSMADSVIKTTAKELAGEYRDGTWNGSKKRVKGTVYFVNEHGEILTTGGDHTGIYPDIADDYNLAIGHLRPVRIESADGIIAINRDHTEITYFCKGEIISSENIGDLGETFGPFARTLSIGDYVVVVSGQHARIYLPLQNWSMEKIDNAVDVIEKNGAIYFSTFDRENFTLSSSGFTTLDTHWTKFADEDDLKEVIHTHRLLYAGSNTDQKAFYCEPNDDQTSYTLVHRDASSGENSVVSESVIDAEWGRAKCCYYVNEDGKVFYYDGNESAEVFSGTAYGLATVAYGEYSVCAIVPEEEANDFVLEGWDNVYLLN